MDINKIKVTKHAITRFKQRFYYSFHISNFYHDELTTNLIASLVENGNRIWWWELCPFYKNKIQSVHGEIFVIKAKNMEIYFPCIINNGKLFVKSALTNFDPTQKVKFKS